MVERGARINERTSVLQIDADTGHAGQIDRQSTIAHRIADYVVPTTADGNLETMIASIAQQARPNCTGQIDER